MEKEFIQYQQALQLKELGFDESCFGFFVDGELRGINLGLEELGGKEPYYQRFDFHTISNHDIDNPNKIVVTAPLYQQAFRWFREKYNFYNQIHKGYGWEGIVRNSSNGDILWNDGTYNSTEEAELACLIKLIEIVKNTSTQN